MYETPETKILNQLNTIQNQCLRACTGAFKSSPAASLCVEAGVPPLKYSRDIVCLNFFFKTLALQDLPTHQVLVGSPETEPPPKREYIDSLITHYQVRTPKILSYSVPEKPPWTHSQVKVCPFIEVTKSNRPNEEVRAEFLSHLGNHPTNHIYTDGSKMNQGVGFAAVTQNNTNSGGLPAEASIFTAELYAIRVSLNNIIEGGERGDNFTIFSDSRSALLALKKSSTRSPLVGEIKELIHRARTKNVEIELCWVPGHANIAGNERADAAAKQAAITSNQTLEGAIPHTDMKQQVKDVVFRRWQQDWNSLGQEGRKLRQIKQDVGIWRSSENKSRRIETALTRLRIGHTNMTHSYLMQGQANPPECEVCSEIITVKHLLLSCSKYRQARNKHLNNLTISQILAEGNNFSSERLINFLKETNLLAKI